MCNIYIYVCVCGGACGGCEWVYIITKDQSLSVNSLSIDFVDPIIGIDKFRFHFNAERVSERV
jgi:hypothetical protein